MGGEGQKILLKRQQQGVMGWEEDRVPDSEVWGVELGRGNKVEETLTGGRMDEDICGPSH